MFPEKTITVNIDGKDYQSERGVFLRANGCAHDQTLFQAVKKDWNSLAGFILDMAEIWMCRMGRTECQVTYNHGNGSVAVGKHGRYPNTPNPFSDEDDAYGRLEKVRLMLAAHPDNKPNSEFADQISSIDSLFCSA